MGSPTTIGVDDDLATGEAGVGLGATDDEGARGVDDDLGVLEHLSRANLLDDLFGEDGSDLLVGHGGGVLGGDENIIDTNWLHSALLVGVLNDDLGLAIGSQPGDCAVVASLGHLLADEVGEVVRVGVEGLGIPLVGGIAKHDTLISGTEVVHILLDVHSLGDFLGLSLDVDED